MTGTVDIQELMGRARWLKDYGVKTMICDPPTILALIEALERQEEALELVQQNVEASASSYQERVETISRVVRAALNQEPGQ